MKPPAPAVQPTAPAPEASAALPAVAIVGRPNVGKSALFNRLAGRQISIVHDQPGITRDRLVAECRLAHTHPFEIIDTGGIGSDADGDFSARVRTEAEIGIAAAAVVLFVVDGRAGLTPVDQELARFLRRADKPVLLVVNKIDEAMHSPLESEFARLGFAEVLGVSAAHGRGITELVGAVTARLPAPPPAAPEDDTEPDAEPDEETASRRPRVANRPPLVALVGRPNVGKSSLTNAILGEQRTIVSDVSGTTRDAVDVPCEIGGKRYVLIDTAGIRHRGKRDNSAEIFSVMRSENSIKRADLCILVIDASAGVTQQDRQIAGLIQRANKPCVIAVNKWDLLTPPGGGDRTEIREYREAFLDRLRAELFFLNFVPLVALSALKGEQIPRLFTAVEKTRRAAVDKVGTGPLNRLLQAAIELQPPPLRANKRFKLLYATQLPDKAASPIPVPIFLLFVNDPATLTDPYRKYLENKLRETFPYPGLPVLFKQRGREQKDAD